MEVGDGRSLREIGADLERTWQRRLDKAASRPLAYAAWLAVHNDVDPLRDYDGVVAAAEFLWDADEELLLARALLRTWRRRVHQLTVKWDAALALEPRFRALMLESRLAFRANEYASARFWADAAVRQLRQIVGGDVALSQIVAGAKPTRAGELYCAFLASQLPVMRMSRAPWVTDTELYDRYIEDAQSIIRHFPVYDRLPALVTQTFFAVAARDDPRDRQVVDLLADLDRMLRPDTARAQCTRLLVEMTLAGHRGELEAEQALARAAEQALRKAGLHRHIKALNSRGWWKLRPAA